MLIPIPTILKTIRLRGGGSYRRVMERGFDCIQFDDVCWRPYEEHMEIQGFEEVFWYSGWIMCGVRRVYRHLPERVLRQYGYVQWVPRHPTDVVELLPPQIVQAFVDFRTHTLKEPDWGEPAREQTWRMAMCYGTVQCLTLRFCHFFQEIFPDQQMKSRSCTVVGAVRGERLA